MAKLNISNWSSSDLIVCIFSGLFQLLPFVFLLLGAEHGSLQCIFDGLLQTCRKSVQDDAAKFKVRRADVGNDNLPLHECAHMQIQLTSDAIYLNGCTNISCSPDYTTEGRIITDRSTYIQDKVPERLFASPVGSCEPQIQRPGKFPQCTVVEAMLYGCRIILLALQWTRAASHVH